MDRVDTTTTGYNRTNRNAMADNLARLDDLDDFKVADGDPDIRGWDVIASDGRKVGEVDDLIVDTDLMQVAFVDVEVDRGLFNDDRHVLVPIREARLDDTADNVLLGGMTVARFGELSPYRRGTAIDAAEPRATEKEVRDCYGKRGCGKLERLTLSEEQLRVGKRELAAGEAHLAKTVETEHVRQNVPLTREEVTVETRPITPGSKVTDTDIADGEIRIPLKAEEVVVEKRVVPTEEVVVSKRVVQENEVVEADLRREKLDLERSNVRPDKRH